ncbi:hypothetical protein BDA96_03G107800 [Sorghum bicolor]|uniref:Knottin scorpion toxin-like domain-containing protein n=2 Tax=Sorghum bicolor TaxID=4558 RepID=A0A921RBQ2_SORBI|nr:hypothetical protein BDA96_03G107800 [Sorghum bicolor]KXG32118.1 hypothetical protein SORBI_3003G103100 [Sorghum bicolor]
MMKIGSTKRQQTFCPMFPLMLTILLISSQENLGTNAQVESCVHTGLYCMGTCLVRGACNRCCKESGCTHGKCSILVGCKCYKS